MIRVTIDRQKKYRFAIYAKNGNELCHSAKGYSSMADIERIIGVLRSGDYDAEVETANIAVKGHAVYFMLIDNSGETIALSNVYKSENHRNTHNQVYISVKKTLTNLYKYLDKVCES